MWDLFRKSNIGRRLVLLEGGMIRGTQIHVERGEFEPFRRDDAARPRLLPIGAAYLDSVGVPVPLDFPLEAGACVPHVAQS